MYRSFAAQTAHTHADAATVVAVGPDRVVALQELRRVLREHLPVLDEAAGRENHSPARADQALLVADPGHHTHYAAGVVGILNREGVSAAFMFGGFYAESLLLAEAGHQVGAIQVAGTPSTMQIPFFIAACDYTIIGDEFYAASAYLSREPTLLGSWVGQDYSKLLMLVVVVVGIAAVTLLPSAGVSEVIHRLLRFEF